MKEAKHFKTKSTVEEIINLEDLWYIWKKETSFDNSFLIRYKNQKGNTDEIYYDNKDTRDKDFIKIEKLLTKQGGSWMEGIKNYFKKHEEMFITIAMLLILDEYIFDGKFRDKIKDLMDSFINKTKRNLEVEDKKDE